MNKQPVLVTNSDQLDEQLALLRAGQGRLGLVPTMGALHDGHLSLVRRSLEECQATVVTIFVNPAQFNNDKDREDYPQDLDRDLGLLAQAGVDLIFAPPQSDIYPDGFADWVEPPRVADRWEGEQRPGHFRGVCTVVRKLFQLIPADIAYFGEKDYQQSIVIKHLIDQMAIPIELMICPIVREQDGLAMSTRNAYLSSSDRQQASAIWECLRAAGAMVLEGESSSPVIIKQLTEELQAACFTQVDYVAIVDPQTLDPQERIEGPVRLLVAARLGTTRLIDNCLLSPGERETVAP